MRNKKGFTLVELIATIAVIGLLLVISTGTIINGIDGAKSNINDAQKELLFSTAELYFDDNVNLSIGITNYTICVQKDLVGKGYFEEFKDSNGNDVIGIVTLSIEWEDETIKNVKATSFDKVTENSCDT